MRSKEEKMETVYEVILVRTDREFPTVVLQSTNYDECYTMWQQLHEKWQETSDNNKVFIMEEPFVTAFNPLLIREITLRPIVEQSVGKHKNPYQQQMLDKGLANMFNGPEILDGGYR